MGTDASVCSASQGSTLRSHTGMGRVSCSPPWPDSNHWTAEGEKEEEDLS